MTWPITVVSQSAPLTFAGPSCGICGQPAVGIHECSITALLERAEFLKNLARAKFERACQPTRGPEEIS